MISWSLCEDPDAPAPSPLVVKAIVADGARVVRGRLLGRRAAEQTLLADELSDLCCFAAASPLRPPDGRRLDQPVAHLDERAAR